MLPVLARFSVTPVFDGEIHALLGYFAAYIALTLAIFCLRVFTLHALREFLFWALGFLIFTVFQILHVFAFPGYHDLFFLSTSINTAVGFETLSGMLLASYVLAGFSKLRDEAVPRSAVGILTCAIVIGAVLFLARAVGPLRFFAASPLLLKKILDAGAVGAYSLAGGLLLLRMRHHHPPFPSFPFWFLAALGLGVFTHISNLLWVIPGDIFFYTTHVGKIVFLTFAWVGLLEFRNSILKADPGLGFALDDERGHFTLGQKSTLELIENMSEGVVVADSRGTLKFSNRAFREMLHYDNENISGLHISVFFDTTNYEKLLHYSVQKKSTQRRCDLELLTQENRKLPVSLDMVPISNPNGKISGTQYTVTDLTERRRIERDWHNLFLEKTRDLEVFQECIENSCEGVLITDAHGYINYVNQTFEMISGYEDEELLGRTTEIFIYNQRSEIAHEKIWDLAKEGRVWRGEFHTRRKDGSGFLGEVSVVPIKSTHRSDDKCLWLERDITRRRSLETSLKNYAERLTNKTDELEASRAYYESLISGMSDILLVVDNDGHCTFLNDYGRRRLGFRAEELSKEKLPVFFDDLKRLEKDYGAAIQVEIKNFEAAITPKAGQPILCSWYARPLVDRFSQRIGAMAVGRDITEYKMLQDQLQDHARTLEKSVQDRTVELEKKVSQLGKLLEIGEEILLNVDVDVIINRICEAIQSLGWQRVIVSLRDEETHCSRPVATAGLAVPEVEEVMKWGDIPFAHTEKYFKERFRISHSYFVPKEEDLITTDTRYAVFTDLGERGADEWHSLDALLVPIRTRDKILGTISVDDPVDRKRPDVNRVRDLEIFADKGALAIENARLVQAQKENEREATFLAGIGKIFHSSLNMEEVIAAVVQRGAMAIGELCSLLLLDEKNDLLVPEATHHTNPAIVEYFIEGMQKHPCPAGEGIVGSAVKTAKSCLLSKPFSEEGNELAQPPFYYIEKFQSISSLMVTPLRARGKTIGAMLYLLFDAKRKYKKDELRLAQELADRAALAVENARLFTEAGEKAAELEKASKMKSEFLANMSHELRTPLNAIITLSDILLRTLAESEGSEQLKQMQIIQRSGRNLLNLINDILDLSKIESGGVQPVYAEVPLPAVVEETIEHIRPLCLRKGLTLDYDFARNVPDTVYTDQDKLTKALTNVLSNAVKFTRTGGISVNMSVQNRKEIRIDVFDTGIGIPAERLQEIFKEFHQIDSTDSRMYGGTGLGLAITKKVLGIIGGSVHVESELGKGSTFTIVFPVRSRKDVKPVEAHQIEATPPEDNASESTLEVTDDRLNLVPNKRTILVVDDEKDSLYIISHYLREGDYQVVFCSNGEDVLHLAKRYEPFAITLDVLMPNQSGWEILQMLKSDEDTKAIPVIMTTILSEKERALELGADEYLTKPFEPETLMNYLAAFAKEKKRRGLFDWPRLLSFGKRKRRGPGKNGMDAQLGSKILLVDDDKDTQYSVRIILESAGYQVFFANEGREALEKADLIQPNLILMDIMMPGMNGYETTRALRESDKFKRTPIVAVTAKAMKGDREKTIYAGCDDYLAKPFGTEEILHVVRRWLAVSLSN
ncbi:MAG: response regulator [bacterium]